MFAETKKESKEKDFPGQAVRGFPGFTINV